MAKYTSTQEITSTWTELNTSEENVAVQWLSGPKIRVAVADSAVDLASGDFAHLLGSSVPCANFTELAGKLVCVRSENAVVGAMIAITKY